MSDLSLDEFKKRGLSEKDLRRRLRKEAIQLLGPDLLRANHRRRKRRPSSQGLGRSIWFFREERKCFTFSRKGLRIFTFR